MADTMFDKFYKNTMEELKMYDPGKGELPKPEGTTYKGKAIPEMPDNHDKVTKVKTEKNDESEGHKQDNGEQKPKTTFDKTGKVNQQKYDSPKMGTNASNASFKQNAGNAQKKSNGIVNKPVYPSPNKEKTTTFKHSALKGGVKGIKKQDGTVNFPKYPSPTIEKK